MAWHNGGSWDGLPVNDIPIILAELCTAINEKQAVVGVTETEWDYADTTRPSAEDFAGAPMAAVGVIWSRMYQAIYGMSYSYSGSGPLNPDAPQWYVSRYELDILWPDVFGYYALAVPDCYYNYGNAKLYIYIRRALELFVAVWWPLIPQDGTEGAEEVEYAFDNTTTPTETPLTMWEDFAAYAGTPVHDKAVFVKIDSSVASGTRTCRMERNYDATITMTCPVAPQGVQSEDPICSFSFDGRAKYDGSIFPGDPQRLYIDDPSLPVSEMYEKQYAVRTKSGMSLPEFLDQYGISINGVNCPFTEITPVLYAFFTGSIPSEIKTEQTQEISVEWTGDTSLPFEYVYGSYDDGYFGGHYCDASAWPGGDMYIWPDYEEGTIEVDIYFRIFRIYIKTTV